MIDFAYPPVMGLFCVGYALHLMWNAWQHRSAQRAIIRWSLTQQELAGRLEIIWASFDPTGDRQ